MRTVLGPSALVSTAPTLEASNCDACLLEGEIELLDPAEELTQALNDKVAATPSRALNTYFTQHLSFLLAITGQDQNRQIETGHAMVW